MIRGMSDIIPLREIPLAGAGEQLRWIAHWTIHKYRGDGTDPANLYAVEEIPGNLITYGGASALWQQLIGSGTVTAFNNANAYLGVGDSSTAAAATQTDLQASTNKIRVGMDSTYPQHTDGTSSSTNATITYRSTFGTSVANFAWNEFGLFNASTAGRMLNRKVESHGTKASGDTWTLTLTISIS